jgi:hypothetical protein
MFNVAHIARPHDRKFFFWLQWAPAYHEINYLSEYHMFCVECVLSHDRWKQELCACTHFVADELKKEKSLDFFKT